MRALQREIGVPYRLGGRMLKFRRRRLQIANDREAVARPNVPGSGTALAVTVRVAAPAE